MKVPGLPCLRFNAGLDQCHCVRLDTELPGRKVHVAGSDGCRERQIGRQGAATVQVVHSGGMGCRECYSQQQAGGDGTKGWMCPWRNSSGRPVIQAMDISLCLAQ